ncbi:MAG: SAM-dependent methyltransferase [Ruminococcaceae bacterium]|nr:SAM-dependent methyltransferase [Oscillospiraceae bacterium]
MENFLLYPDERIDEVNEKIRLIQKKDGLTFGTDAYLLAAYMKPQKNGRAAELGSGTGIISLLLAARERFSEIHAFEVQQDFAELSERNAALNSLDNMISVHRADVRDVRPEDVGGELDVVFSNPPYMLVSSGKANLSDAKNIARHEVFGGIGDFCAAAKRMLKFGGKFYCVWRPDRLTALLSALAENKLELKKMTFVHADTNAKPSMVLISATKGGAPSLEVTPPLILHENFRGESARELTERAQRIYDTMSFD